MAYPEGTVKGGLRAALRKVADKVMVPPDERRFRRFVGHRMLAKGTRYDPIHAYEKMEPTPAVRRATQATHADLFLGPLYMNRRDSVYGRRK